MTTAEKLAQLDAHSARVLRCGGPKAVEKQHALGKRTARERIELLMDTGSHTKVSIENVQHNQLRNMQNLVSQIETTWRRLHGNMERDLTTEYVKMPVHRIKNMTVKSLLEYRFTGNPDVHACLLYTSPSPRDTR